MDQETVLKRAVTRAGGPSAVARAFGISPVSVGEWIKKDDLPAPRILPLAALTQWEFTPHMLNSDLYPNVSDGLPKTEQVAA